MKNTYKILSLLAVFVLSTMIASQKKPYFMSNVEYSAESLNPKTGFLNGYGRFSNKVQINPKKDISKRSYCKKKSYYETFKDKLSNSLVDRSNFLSKNESFKSTKAVTDVLKGLKAHRNEFFAEQIDKDNTFDRTTSQEAKLKKRYEYYLDKSKKDAYWNAFHLSSYAFDLAPKNNAWFWAVNAGVFGLALPVFGQVNTLESIINSKSSYFNKQGDPNAWKRKGSLLLNAAGYYAAGYAWNMFKNFALNVACAKIAQKIHPSLNRDIVESAIYWGTLAYDLGSAAYYQSFLTEEKTNEQKTGEVFVRYLKHKYQDNEGLTQKERAKLTSEEQSKKILEKRKELFKERNISVKDMNPEQKQKQDERNVMRKQIRDLVKGGFVPQVQLERTYFTNDKTFKAHSEIIVDRDLLQDVILDNGDQSIRCVQDEATGNRIVFKETVPARTVYSPDFPENKDKGYFAGHSTYRIPLSKG